MKQAPKLPNLSCGIANYRGALRHVAGDYRPGTDHNIIADDYARQDDRPTADPNVLTNRYGTSKFRSGLSNAKVAGG
jgi:hypothetical protein